MDTGTMTPAEIEELISRRLEPLRAISQSNSEKLDHVLELLAKFEGAGMLMKLIFLGVAPALAAAYWLKDHIKW
jgi:hypothetical protein